MIEIILIIGILFLKKGFSAVLEFIKKVWEAVLTSFGWINIMFVGLNDNGLFTVLFGTVIIFAIVGVIMNLLNFPRGRKGSVFGKLLFWLIGFPVCFILNYLSGIVFNR